MKRQNSPQPIAIFLAAIAFAFGADFFTTPAHAQRRRPAQVDNPSAPNNSLPPGTSLKSANGKVDFEHAQPEDITNKNFPNLIESFDYPNADIAEVVKAISKLTGKNFILEKGVSGKISIIAPSRITVAEAYKAFLTALAMNNYTVVPDGDFLKIRSLQAASKENIDTYSGAYFPHTDQLITRIIKLKYINADDVQKTLHGLINQNGDITPYAPTNSLIITDMGSNIDRIENIINQLDVPGFEEKLVVMPIRYARAKDISDLISKIINKGQDQQNQFTPGFPRFRPYGAPTGSGTSGAASYQLVIPDLRTNSIIVVGNDAGIARIRGLVNKLDYPMRTSAGAGVYVYYVRFGEAENIAKVLNGIAQESKKEQQAATQQATTQPAFGAPAAAPAAPVEPIFGSDVKVTADKETNSIVVTAARQDWVVVRDILQKLDIPRDQVFVKAIIMEMDAQKANNWGVNYYKFLPGTNGLGRWDLVTNSNPVSLLDPTQDQGLNLGWGAGSMVTVQSMALESMMGGMGGGYGGYPGVGGVPGQTGINPMAGAFAGGVQVPSLLSMINLIKKTTNSNILSAPTLTAIDNEKATIEVGENVPVSSNESTANNGQTTNSIDRHDLTLKMELTPYISPDTDTVRLKIHNKIEQLAPTQVAASTLNNNAVSYTKRDVNTQIIVNSGDTSVIGGLMQDKDSDTVAKVPILGDIPILGWLFKSDQKAKEKDDLLIFITPRIIRNAQDSHQVMDDKLSERLDFIKKYEDGRDPYGAQLDKLPRRADASSPNYEKKSGSAVPDENAAPGTDQPIDQAPPDDVEPDNSSSDLNGPGASVAPKSGTNNSNADNGGAVEEGD